MPTKYCDRLRLPIKGCIETNFSTKNGLKIANGYKRVIFTAGKPLIEFSKSQILLENIHIPNIQKWKVENKNCASIEFRSKDYCNIKISQVKDTEKFYISIFDLISDQIPVLIDPLLRKKTLLLLD